MNIFNLCKIFKIIKLSKLTFTNLILKTYNKNNKGFTLVELIVVIVILGILAVTAASKYMNYKLEAKNAVLQTLAASLKSAAASLKYKIAMENKPGDYPGQYPILNPETLEPCHHLEIPSAGMSSYGCLEFFNGYPRPDEMGVFLTTKINFYYNTWREDLKNPDPDFKTDCGVTVAPGSIIDNQTFKGGYGAVYKFADAAVCTESFTITSKADYIEKHPCTVGYIPAPDGPITIVSPCLK